MKKIFLAFAIMISASIAIAQSGSYTISGQINHTEWTPNQESLITFNHMPSNYNEFVGAMEQLGTEPQGVIALQLMAFELYRKDRELGEKCLKMINTETNLPSVLRIIRDLFSDSEYGQGFLIASYMKGATPDNGYNPVKPYQIEVRTNPVNKYQESNSLKGYVLYLQVKSSAYDSEWRGVEVVRQKGEKHYRVSNCPSIYMKGKSISWKTEAEFNGLD